MLKVRMKRDKQFLQILDILPFWKKLKISKKIFYAVIIGLFMTILLFGFNIINIINLSKIITKIDEIKERQLFFERFNKEMTNFQINISYISTNIQNGISLQQENESKIISIYDLKSKVEQAAPIVKKYVPEKEKELKETFNELFKAVDNWTANKNSVNLGYINGVFYNALTVTDYVITLHSKLTKENIEQIERQKEFSLKLGIVLNLVLIIIFLIMMFPLLSEIKTVFLPLLNASEIALNGANESLTYSTQINQSIKQLSQVLNTMTISIGDVSNNADESSALSSNIISSVKIATDLVGDLACKASDTLNRLTSHQKDLQIKIHQIKNMTQDISSALNVVTSNTDIAEKLNTDLAMLEVNMKEISGLLNMMTGINEETNMLSINASIEAARADKYGKGFEVVAGRIRQLSNQTKNMTIQITNTINGIEKVSLVVTKSLNNVITSVRDSAQKVSLVIEELPEIERVFQSIYEANKIIIDIANIQLSSTNQIHFQSNQIAHLVDNISIETDNVSMSMQELAASSEEINAQLESISEMVDATHHVIEKQVGLAYLAKQTTEQV